jgi:hypothetical protein
MLGEPVKRRREVGGMKPFIKLLIALSIGCYTQVAMAERFPFASPASRAHSNEPNLSEPKNLQPIPPDSKQFESLWKSFQNCEALPTAKDGYISSEYLRQRGYSASDPEGKGYVEFDVDETFYGMKVTNILLPTTWTIYAMTIKAPLGSVKRKIEKVYGFKFTSKQGQMYIRKLSANPEFGEGAHFVVLPDREDPKNTALSCDLDQQ